MYDNFFLSSQYWRYDQYSYEAGPLITNTRLKEDDPFYTLSFQQGTVFKKTNWHQTYLMDFLSDIGGLFTSLMAGASFLISTYQNFVSQKSLLKRLYGEQEVDLGDEFSRIEDPSASETPRDQLKKQIEKRREFTASFGSYILASCFQCFCCCFERRCSQKCKRNLDSWKKIKVA